MKRRRNVEGRMKKEEGGRMKEEGGRRTEIFSDNIINVMNNKVFSLLPPPSSLLPPL